MKRIASGLLVIIGLAYAYIAYAQNAKETIEKRKIEKYIELGSGDFTVNDVTNISGETSVVTSSSTGNWVSKFGSDTTNIATYVGHTSVGGFIQSSLANDFSAEYNIVLQPNGGNAGVGVEASANQTLRINGVNGKGLGLDLAGSGDYVIQESSTAGIVQFGPSLYHNISSGNIGILFSNPTEALYVGGAASIAGGLGSADHDAVLIDQQTSTNTGRILSAGAEAGDTPSLVIGTAVNGSPTIAITIDSAGRTALGASSVPEYTTAVVGTVGSNGDLLVKGAIGSFSSSARDGLHLGFDTTGTYARIAASSSAAFVPLRVDGDIGIGVIPNSNLHIEENQNDSTLIRIQNETSGTVANARVTFDTDGGVAEMFKTSTSWTSGAGGADTFNIINESGGVYLSPTATSWSAISDIRFKENWVELDKAIEKVMTLRAGTYNLIGEDKEDRKVGLVAQDILKVLPEAVSQDDPNKLGLKYTEVLPLAIKAIQEQQNIIDKQKSEIDLMKNWICLQPDYPITLCGGN